MGELAACAAIPAGEVAIGEAHPRAAEAAVVGLLDMEARLEWHALERRANCLASDPESVPAGSDTGRAGPAPRNWTVPITEPSP
jgi:hypothetical protein